MELRKTIWAWAAVLAACSAPKEQENGTTAVTSEDELPTVEVEILKTGNFAREIISNGTLSSIRKAELRWGTSGIITHIYARNGERVSQGQVIAEVDKEKLNLALMQAADSKQRAYLEMQDFLIGQGYKLGDSLSVPQKVKELAVMKSGYGQACLSYQAARMALQEATLRAPFSGTIANQTAKPHNQAGNGEVFCTLLDNSSMEVTFPVMEHEIRSIQQGDTVQVALYAEEENRTFGRVSSINPLVGENGLTSICAVITKTPPQWFDGMKVKVNMRQNVSDKLVVPKQAVVMRDGRRVVFTVRNGRAYWNYVNVGLENSFSYTITKGLKDGDSVIVSGNQNLAHFTPITLKTTHTAHD